MANRDDLNTTSGEQSVPTGDHAASTATTSRTIGYDSAQKSGYDDAEEASEARRTINDIDTDARSNDRERAEDERDAHQDNATGPLPGAASTAQNVADHVGTRTENQTDLIRNRANHANSSPHRS